MENQFSWKDVHMEAEETANILDHGQDRLRNIHRPSAALVQSLDAFGDLRISQSSAEAST